MSALARRSFTAGAALGALVLGGCTVTSTVPAQPTATSATSTAAASSAPTPSASTPSTPQPSSVDSGASGGTPATVLRVVDGDTIEVQYDNGTGTVRLLGIDTPEIHGKKECYGPQASEAVKGLTPPGTRVVLVTDPTQDRMDRYGRLLAYVSRTDGLDVGLALLRDGFARAYRLASGKPPSRWFEYYATQEAAQGRLVGLWKECPL